MSPTQPPINYIPEAKSVLVPDDQLRALGLLARIPGLEHAIWGPVCGAQTDKRRDVHSWCGTWDCHVHPEVRVVPPAGHAEDGPSADMTVILAARGIKACSLSGSPVAEQRRHLESGENKAEQTSSSLHSPYYQSPKLYVIHPTRARHKP
ncbi:uncharacterized protein P884DRAFT_312236 [Thermothelomyces heterothallicus CBS 202.75]|uniref:uncharacterized protein n=1 Tax=Thermothelomyces heterothallicus CBS 202.75 TaxID=1149848 RepID=UPI0037448A32